MRKNPTDSLNALQSYLQTTAKVPYDSQLRNHVRYTRIAPEKRAPVCRTVEEAQIFIGQEVSVSDWLLINQDQVNRFAEATGDYQFLHIDHERASRESCYGGTIAHGLLTLSLIPMFATHGTIRIQGAQTSIIYGIDRVRYLNPLRVGKRIRARFSLISASERSSTEVLMNHRVTIDIEDELKPAMIADWIIIRVLPDVLAVEDDAQNLG